MAPTRLRVFPRVCVLIQDFLHLYVLLHLREYFWGAASVCIKQLLSYEG